MSVAPGGSPAGPPRSLLRLGMSASVAARHEPGVSLARRSQWGLGWAGSPALRGVWETVGHMCPGGAGGMGPHEEGRARAASAWARPEGVSPLWVPVGEGMGPTGAVGWAGGEAAPSGSTARSGCASGPHEERPRRQVRGCQARHTWSPARGWRTNMHPRQRHGGQCRTRQCSAS